MSESDKVTTLFKRALGVVSTFKGTPWYNETNGRHRNIVESKDINIEKTPELPEWADSYLDSSDISALGFDLDVNDFATNDISFTDLHLYSSTSKTYTISGEKLPGMYLDESVGDTSGVVALFVRLKLDKMEGEEHLDPSAIVYTKYNSSSQVGSSLMNSAYEFNYKTKLNVASGIEVFKPYNYTLEYSYNTSSTFETVNHSDGNWIFDNETGVIIFEDDPGKDLSNGDLYFTFVKYIGVQGLENLMYYSNGKIGIGNKNPQSELDISGSVNITGDLEIDNNLTIGGGVMFVDSSNTFVGINKLNPNSALDVSGNVSVRDSLTITNGVGNGGGFCPIGTIIMWPTNSFDSSNLFGDWHLCDGTDLSAQDFQDLSNVMTSSNGKIYLPDFSNKFIRGAKSVDTTITSGGSNTATFDICINHIPVHDHNVTDHIHDISGNDGHSHTTNSHTHTITDNGHVHTTKPHSHNITDSGHSHATNSHIHTITDNGHAHTIASHTHNFAVSGTQYTNVSSNQIDASSNFTIVSTSGTSSGQTYSAISASNKDVAINSSNSGITMAQSGGGETTNKNPYDNISIVYNGDTETTVTNPDSNINIDNFQITTNNNVSSDTLALECVVNPYFHTLFFFIRVS